MEFDGNHTNNIEMWEWQGDDCTLQCNTGFVAEIAQFLLDEDQNDGNLLDMLGGQTPIKDCTDFGYDFFDIGDSTYNELKECRDSSQAKRRRLQFTYDVNDATVFIEHNTSDFVNSKVAEDSLIGDEMDNLQWHSQWNPGFIDDSCGYGNQGLDQSPEGWMETRFNNSNQHCSPDEMNDYVTLDDQINISGSKSYIKTPMKLTTSIAYPFTLIKPCGVQGDLTLKDINQRIHAPHQSRSKKRKDEERSVNYSTSAFTGKPVVVKTKIHTEGRKGSITIMRTKG